MRAIWRIASRAATSSASRPMTTAPPQASSKRVDYVNGSSTSPVAFLEGLYVEPAARRKGVARALVEAVAAWASAEGCRELASDSPLGNTAAHAVHRALGFAETERVVYFLRTLPDL